MLQRSLLTCLLSDEAPITRVTQQPTFVAQSASAGRSPPTRLKLVLRARAVDLASSPGHVKTVSSAGYLARSRPRDPKRSLPRRRRRETRRSGTSKRGMALHKSLHNVGGAGPQGTSEGVATAQL